MNELSIFDSLFNDCMENAFGYSRKHVSAPKVDVTESEKSYNIEMELPGRDEKNVDIQIEKGVLTISSKTEENTEIADRKKSEKREKPEKIEAEKNASETENAEKKSEETRKYLVRERRVFEFSRSFSLPDDVDEEKASASFRNGILSVILPRKEKPLPKKISVKVA